MVGFAYLAQPYTHPMMSYRVKRFMEAQHVLEWAFKENLSVFSPIVHWHNLAIARGLPPEFQHWQAQNDPMIEACGEFWILPLPGWQSSKGLTHEWALARNLEKPIKIIDLTRSGYNSFVFEGEPKKDYEL